MTTDISGLLTKENNPENTVHKNYSAKYSISAREFLALVKAVLENQAAIKDVSINGIDLESGKDIVFKLSDFLNDAGYLTAHQSLVGLAKYTDIIPVVENAGYATIEYVDGEIAKIDTEIFIVCLTLPTLNINENKIYIVPSTDSLENNVFLEYKYVNGNWELFGDPKLDLTPYAKTVDVEGNYVKNTTLRNYYTKAEVLQIVNNMFYYNEETRVLTITTPTLS